MLGVGAARPIGVGGIELVGFGIADEGKIAEIFVGVGRNLSQRNTMNPIGFDKLRVIPDDPHRPRNLRYQLIPTDLSEGNNRNFAENFGRCDWLWWHGGLAEPKRSGRYGGYEQKLG